MSISWKHKKDCCLLRNNEVVLQEIVESSFNHFTSSCLGLKVYSFRWVFALPELDADFNCHILLSPHLKQSNQSSLGMHDVQNIVR